MAINQLGVIGLGTMGANLARNAARNGAKVAVYNRTTETMHEFIKAHGKEGTFVPCKTYAELLRSLDTPRAIMIMVKAGGPVDAVIEELLPDLEEGDILIDGGNSHYADPERRTVALGEKGIRFLGMGVSGGEEGALHGPSMMPGGDKSAWKDMSGLFTKMASNDGIGGKCIAYMGPGGAGHFVKMVHNGIEYGVMQLIAETYDVLKNVGGHSNAELAEIYERWNEGDDLRSFLVEITAKIFARDDDIIDLIADRAGQKGTGKWTTNAALELGVPIPTINAAVDARILSGDIEKRSARNLSEFPVELDEQPMSPAGKHRLCQQARAALECSILCAFNQGFQLLEIGSKEYDWKIDLSEVARIWRGGCIIRAAFLAKFQLACNSDEGAAASGCREILERFGDGRQADWRTFVLIATAHGVGIPAVAVSLSYYDTIRRERLPQNLIQAQRDFFGAHTYERVDQEGVFHTEWE